MTKLYTACTADELRQEIKRLKDLPGFNNESYEHSVGCQTYLEKLREELLRRGEGKAPENGGGTPPG